MKTPSIYLNFDGNCREAFEFYKSVFGGEFSFLEKYGDDDNPMQVAENEKDFVLYVHLNVGGTSIAGSDVLPSQWQTVTKGNSVAVVINADSKEEADDMFAKLSVSGNIEVPMSQQFFGYFGQLEDKFGVHWMIIAE